ncbi:MAG: DinB family protein [Candidatus Latescibacterota bacterium]|nr:MAG: DinB family protein [Candidatus Latescibacterota bacterium]
MPTYKSILEETLEAWEDVRFGIIEEVRNIPGGRFDYRPTPDVMSVHDLVAHILEISMMMTEELTAPDANFHRMSFGRLIKKHAAPVRAATTKGDLVKLLRSQFRDAERKFRSAGELHLLQFITRFDGEKGTRLAWLHHGIAQEMYHRGQLTVYERLMGIVPALTKRIRGG